MRLVFVAALVSLGCGARTELTCNVDGCGGTNDGSGTVDGGFDDTSVSDDTSATLDDSGGFVFDATDDLPPPEDTAADVPPVTGCPSALPKLDTACVPPLDCFYVGCDLTTKDHAACVSGKWAITASACSSTSDRCPVALPPDGSTCTLPSAVSCMWSTKCLASDYGQCNGGKWSFKHRTYENCTAGTCPSSFPTKGTACPKTAPGTGFTCIYLNECGVYEDSSCTGSAWGFGEPDPESLPVACDSPAPCPKAEPSPGEKCTAPISGYQICVWKNGCGGVDSGRCSGGTDRVWVVSRPPCPSSGCPTTPVTGSACSGSETCTYPTGAGCTLVCSCASSAWGCTQPPCSAGK